MLGTQGWVCRHHATEVHEDTAVGQKPMQDQEGQRDDVGGGIPPAGTAGHREEACGEGAGSALPNIFIPCIFSFSREFSSTRRSKAAEASPGGTPPPGS